MRSAAADSGGADLAAKVERLAQCVLGCASVTRHRGLSAGCLSLTSPHKSILVLPGSDDPSIARGHDEVEADAAAWAPARAQAENAPNSAQANKPSQ